MSRTIIGGDPLCRLHCRWFATELYRAHVRCDGKPRQPQQYCTADVIWFDRDTGQCLAKRHIKNLAEQAIDLGEIAKAREAMDHRENLERMGNPS